MFTPVVVVVGDYIKCVGVLQLLIVDLLLGVIVGIYISGNFRVFIGFIVGLVEVVQGFLMSAYVNK